MRLFVAIEMPRPLCRQLAERVAGVRRELPRVRWLEAQGLHLTLVFLGSVDREALAGLEWALTSAFARHGAFRLQPGGAGAFPPGRRPRVLWVGFAPSEELQALQQDVAAAAHGAVGSRPEGRRFHPHVTLARCRAELDGEAAARWQAAFPPDRLDGLDVVAGVLMESRLEPTGVRYRRLAEFPLAQEAA